LKATLTTTATTTTKTEVEEQNEKRVASISPWTSGTALQHLGDWGMATLWKRESIYSVSENLGGDLHELSSTGFSFHLFQKLDTPFGCNCCSRPSWMLEVNVLKVLVKMQEGKVNAVPPALPIGPLPDVCGAVGFVLEFDFGEGGADFGESGATKVVRSATLQLIR